MPPGIGPDHIALGSVEVHFMKNVYCVIHMLPWTNMTFLLVLKDHTWIIL